MVYVTGRLMLLFLVTLGSAIQASQNFEKKRSWMMQQSILENEQGQRSDKKSCIVPEQHGIPLRENCHIGKFERKPLYKEKKPQFLAVHTYFSQAELYEQQSANQCTRSLSSQGFFSHDEQQATKENQVAYAMYHNLHNMSSSSHASAQVSESDFVLWQEDSSMNH